MRKLLKPPFIFVMGVLLLGLLASCNHSSNTDTTNGAKCTPPKNHTLDKNGDGKVLMGVATPGPRDDGAYYQSLVESVQEVSRQNCFASPIIVDSIASAEAEPLIRGLARQGVDFIAIGGTDITGPLEKLIGEFKDITWYCHCGSDYQDLPRLIRSNDDSSEINYSAGQATGLLLKRTGGSRVLFLGCCDLLFEKESLLAFEAGLLAQDSSFSLTYIPTGNFPFDFDNISGAVEALEAQKDNIDAVYPFLGGAHEPVIQRANMLDIITLSAGASNVCERTDLKYGIAVRFSPGDYLETILKEIISGQLREGEIREFGVGQQPDVVGAKLCNAVLEDVQALDQINQDIGAGKFNQLFSELKSQLPIN